MTIRTKPWLLLAIALAVALVAAISCGDKTPQATFQVTGTVQDVEPTTIDSFTSLTVRDYDGHVWTFRNGRFPAFSPSHLLEHKALGAPVTVTYVEEADGTLRPMNIVDAPLP